MTRRLSASDDIASLVGQIDIVDRLGRLFVFLEGKAYGKGAIAI